MRQRRGRPPWRRAWEGVPEGRRFAANLALVYSEALGAVTPGPLRVVAELTDAAPDCLMLLRQLGIRGPGLWVAYKEVAGGDVQALADLLRGQGPVVAERVAEILARQGGGEVKTRPPAPERG